MILGAPNVLRQCSPCSWVLSQGWKYIYPTLTSEELATKALISELNYDWVSQPQEHKGKSPSFWIILDECAHIRIQNLDQPFPATLPVVTPLGGLSARRIHRVMGPLRAWTVPRAAHPKKRHRAIRYSNNGPFHFGPQMTRSTGALWPSARRFAPAATATVFVASSDWARKNCCSSSFSPPLPGRWESYYCSKTIRKQIFENNFKKSYQKYENVFYQDRSYSKTQPRNNEDAWCLTALAHLTSWSTIYHTKISGGDLGREFYQKTGNLELEDIPTAMLWIHDDGIVDVYLGGYKPALTPSSS